MSLRIVFVYDKEHVSTMRAFCQKSPYLFDGKNRQLSDC